VQTLVRRSIGGVTTRCPSQQQLPAARLPGLGCGIRLDILADFEIRATRTATNQLTRDFLQRGYWVEVYDEDTKELLAGPFDPDQAAPYTSSDRTSDPTTPPRHRRTTVAPFLERQP